MPYIKKIILNTEVTFNDEVVQNSFEPIMQEIIEAFNERLDCTLKKVWIDVGHSVYDLHLELHDGANVEYDDLYFDIKDDNLIGATVSAGINLKKNFDNCLVDKIIQAIKRAKK